MSNVEVLQRNPLTNIGFQTDDVLPRSGLGAVLARSGIGKTAFLVHMAINAMLRGKRVVHISLEDSLEKVDLWYKEVFNGLLEKNHMRNSDELWNNILHNRFMLTMKEDKFSSSSFSTKIDNTVIQNKFAPDLIIIDGYGFKHQNNHEVFGEIISFAKERGCGIWFTIRTHRHDDRNDGVLPSHLKEFDSSFDVAIDLIPDGNRVNVISLRGAEATEDKNVYMDSAFLLNVS